MTYLLTSLSLNLSFLMIFLSSFFFFFFFNDTATTEIYTLSLHDALPICAACVRELSPSLRRMWLTCVRAVRSRSEEHTSELQSRLHLVCRLLLEKKKKKRKKNIKIKKIYKLKQDRYMVECVNKAD